MGTYEVACGTVNDNMIVIIKRRSLRNGWYRKELNPSLPSRPARWVRGSLSRSQCP